MTIYDVEQRSEEWFLLRLGLFTCSDAQAILANGKGLETLAFSKVAERKTGVFAEGYDNQAMQNGRELEELARSAYELETGSHIAKIGFVKLNEWVGGSPDGILGKEGLVEIKCPTNRVYVEYLYYKKIDPKYVAQMQMQMYVTDRKFVDYVVFNPNFEKSLVIERVKRDEDMIRKLEACIGVGVDRAKEILKAI